MNPPDSTPKAIGRICFISSIPYAGMLLVYWMVIHGVDESLQPDARVYHHALELVLPNEDITLRTFLPSSEIRFTLASVSR